MITDVLIRTEDLHHDEEGKSVFVVLLFLSLHLLFLRVYLSNFSLLRKHCTLSSEGVGE